jgi:hypothetical protein
MPNISSMAPTLWGLFEDENEIFQNPLLYYDMEHQHIDTSLEVSGGKQ